jgi:hypothetical protein
MPQLLTATRILERTMPTTARRILVYGAVCLAYLASILLGAGTFYGLASFSRNPGFWGQLGAILGLAACIYGILQFRAVLLYRVDLLHLLAIIKRLTGQELPSGKEQVAQLKVLASNLFASPRESYACYLKIRQLVFEAFANLPPTNRLSSALPKPFSTWLQRGLMASLLGKPATEAILAFAGKEGSLNDLRRGALSFCAHYAEVLKHALMASVFLYGLSLFAFWLFLKPVGWVDASLPSDFGFWRYVVALILTYWIKLAFLDPIVSAALLIHLLHLEGKTPFSEQTLKEWHLKLPSLAELPGEANKTLPK